MAGGFEEPILRRCGRFKLPDAPISAFWHAKVHREPVNQWLLGMVFELLGGDGAVGGGLA